MVGLTAHRRPAAALAAAALAATAATASGVVICPSGSHWLRGACVPCPGDRPGAAAPAACAAAAGVPAAPPARPPPAAAADLWAIASTLPSPFQQTAVEYYEILSAIAAKAPAALLVYGVGRDSAAYARVNAGGTTVFLESDPAWADAVAAEHPGLDIRRVTYPTTVAGSLAALAAGRRTAAATGVAAAAAWDVIVIDAPPGGGPALPGREVPIAEAAAAATRVGKHVDVFVHDANRPLEAAAADAYLNPTGAHVAYDRTRHYVVGGPPPRPPPAAPPVAAPPAAAQ
jgi:hypothetical protein